MSVDEAGRRDVLDRAAIESELARHHGLDDVALTPLGGELATNVRVTTADGEEFLAKVRRGAALVDAPAQDALLLHLASRDVPVPVPSIVPTVDGETSTAIALSDEIGSLVLCRWVSGTEMVKVHQHSPELLGHVGAVAAGLAVALHDFEASQLPATHHWDVIESTRAIRQTLEANPGLGSPPFVDKVLANLGAVEPLLPGLPRTVTHHDLNDNNVLVGGVGSDQRVVGILDFNDALLSARVAEPSIAAAYAMLRKDDPLAALGHVIAGYDRIVALSPDELAVAFPLVTARLCVQALTWTARQLTSPTPYGQQRVRHTVPALERALQISPEQALEHLDDVTGQERSHA